MSFLQLTHPVLGSLYFWRALRAQSTTYQAALDSLIKSPPKEWIVVSNGAETDASCLKMELDPEELGRGHIGRVFKGRLPAQEPESEGLKALVKLVYPTGPPVDTYRPLYSKQDQESASKLFSLLEHEALLYHSNLYSTDGHVTPICYGYFLSPIAACLVLEDCGSALTFPYRKLPFEDR